MIVATGVSGKLGHRVVDALLERVPASEIVAALVGAVAVNAVASLVFSARVMDAVAEHGESRSSDPLSSSSRPPLAQRIRSD